MSVSEYLSEHVYPDLDAASESLLDDLNPVRVNQYYKLDCPECGKSHRAFYYPGGYIRCNNKNDCGCSISVFDYLVKIGLSNGEIVQKLCAAAGVSLPNSANEVNQDDVLYRTYYRVLRSHLLKSNEAMSYLKETRGLSANDIKRLPLGYFSNASTISNLLKRSLKSKDLSFYYKHDLLPEPGNRDVFNRRIIGFWKQPTSHSSFSILGRTILDETSPKYRYASGLSKEIPFNFSSSLVRDEPLVCVEGAFDCFAFTLLDIPAVATGGSCLSLAQATYLYNKRFTAITYFLNSDIAGFKGALTTIRNCLTVGIRPSFAFSSDHDCDADDLRKRGDSDLLVGLINKPLSHTQLLVKIYRFGISKNLLDLSNAVMRCRNLLTPNERWEFDNTLDALGISGNPDSIALESCANMLSLGIPLDQANKVIHRRFGFKIDFIRDGIKETSNG